jgi:Omp85 superfamily domain
LNQLPEIPALKSAPNCLAIVAVFIVAPAWAQTPNEAVDSARDFELAGIEVAGLDGDGGLEMSGVNFAGNPAKGWFKNWPDDLVIAPIPGRSPQMGWKLTLSGGYFLESRNEDSDASPSVFGGFAMIAEIEFDSHDHEQFPRSGWFVSGRATLYRESLGSDFEADIFKLAINNYRPMGEQNVLALRSVVRSTSGKAPFFLLSSFGGSVDLRGYPSGRYRDAKMYALQGEYRWQYSDRWIFTGFAGFGEVAEDFSRFGRNLLPAAGIGARFVLSQKHRVALSADIAVGKDGTEFYFGVGEAF